jgi:hypothetical protein
MTGSPAVPTVAPSGRFAAVASVAVVGVVVPPVGAALEVVEEVPADPLVDGVVVLEEAGAAVDSVPEPAESASPLNLTPVRSASVLS